MKSVSSVINQALWSGTTFVTTLLLAALLGIEVFGLFAVGLAVRQLVQIVVGCGVIGPYTKLAQALNRDELRFADLRKSLTRVLLLAAVSGVLLTLAISALAPSVPMSFALYLVGGFVVDVQRRFLYVDGALNRDAIGGGMLLVGSVGGLLLLDSLDLLNLSTAFAWLGALPILWVSCVERAWLQSPVQFDSPGIAEIWELGRWGVASGVAGYISTRISTFYALAFAGPSGAAVLELARQCVTAVQLFSIGLANVWQPRLAGELQTLSPMQYLVRVLRLSGLQAAAGSGLLALSILVFWLLLPLLVTRADGAYDAVVPAALILGAASLCQLFSQHPSYSLLLLERPQLPFYVRSAAAIVTLPLGLALTVQWGITGAAWSWLVAEFIVLVGTIGAVFWIVRARSNRQRPSSPLGLVLP